MTWPAWRLLLAMVSCVLLAWSLQRALHGIALGAPAESTYTLTAPRGAPRNPAAASAEVWLRSVYVDGRERALGDLERTGNWQDEGFALVHRGDAEPAAVSVRGRQVTACFLSTKWAGIVRVEGAPGAARDVDLFRDQEASDLVCVDLAGGRVALQAADHAGVIVTRTLVALVPVLVVCVVWRPWTSPGRLEGWILLHVSMLHALVWLTQAVGYNHDAAGYSVGFTALRLATAFPPGYPLFIAACRSIAPAFAGLAVTAAQHGLMVLTLFLLQRMTRAIVPADLASLGFFLAGSVAPTLFMPQAILSENVTLFGMAGALWLASRRTEGPAWRRDLGVGLLTAAATLARQVPVVAMAVPLVLLYAVEHGFGTRTFVRTARVLLIAGALPLLIVVGYWMQGGRLRFTTSDGFHLYHRVVSEQVLLDREGEATRRFLSLVGERPLHRVTHWEIMRDLGKAGLWYGEQERLMGAVAWEGLWTSPAAFAVHSIVMTAGEYASNPMSHVPVSGAGAVPVPMFDHGPPLGLRSSAAYWRADLDWMFGGAWRVLMWLPLVALILLPVLPLPARLTFLGLLSLAGTYLFTSSLVEFFIERYLLPVVPFVLVLAPTPIAALLHVNRRVFTEVP